MSGNLAVFKYTLLNRTIFKYELWRLKALTRDLMFKRTSCLCIGKGKR